MPFILSNRDEDRKIFEAMINKTMASFFRTMGDGKAFSGIDPYSLRRKVKEMGFLPEKGIGFDAALSKVEETVLTNLLRTWSTSYMPHLHSPALLETICSELLIASFNDSMDSWDYYLDRVFSTDTKKKGLPPEYSTLRLYTSEISHFSMDKACHIMGLGYDSVRKIPVDDKCRIDLKAFERMVEEDRAKGLHPFCAVATIGTTDFGSIDPIGGMREICDRYGIHLHADAAYGSGAIMSTTYKSRLGDLSLADSITIDFHKMFLLPISCSAVLMKNGKKLECFQLHADYLNREEDEEDGYINLVGKSMQTTRRFDALKVLMAFQTRGREGFDRMITKVIDNASHFFRLINNDEDFISSVEPELSSVVFALKDGDEVNRRVRRMLLENGTVIGQTVKDGKVMLKFTLLNPNLEKEDFPPIISEIKKCRDKVKEEM